MALWYSTIARSAAIGSSPSRLGLKIGPLSKLEAKVEVKKDKVITSRMIGESMAVGKEKGKVWEKMMNGWVVGEDEHVSTRDDKDLEVEI
ncbi:hypothetical protein Tco_1329808 [Tanacetum coccineum]